MAENSKIQWCDDTVNFWIGCTNVSPACDHCYAESDWGERGRRKRVTWGPHGDRSPTKDPLGTLRKLQRRAERDGRTRNVFINSLSDTFDNHKSIKAEWRSAIWQGARECPDLNLLLLTKRPQNYERYLPEDWGAEGYANVWLGVTAENQEEYDRRSPVLRDTPATVHFFSMEPMLGPITADFLGEWVIVGGESGSKARPMHMAWAHSVIAQCKAAGVACFVKQLGTSPFLRDKKGGDWSEWPTDLRVREMPAPPAMRR